MSRIYDKNPRFVAFELADPKRKESKPNSHRLSYFAEAFEELGQHLQSGEARVRDKLAGSQNRLTDLRAPSRQGILVNIPILLLQPLIHLCALPASFLTISGIADYSESVETWQKAERADILLDLAERTDTMPWLKMPVRVMTAIAHIRTALQEKVVGYRIPIASDLMNSPQHNERMEYYGKIWHELGLQNNWYSSWRG